MTSIYKITLLMLLFSLVSTANNVDKKKYEKSKSVQKDFSVNSNATVYLNNKYGNLNITTWDKNRVEIEVHITVKSDDLEELDGALESIRISFNSDATYVKATTIFDDKNDNNWSWWKKSKNIYYKINYNVKMPKSNYVDLKNDYGTIYLDNLDGKANINCDYGSISIGNLNASNNSIHLEYCSTTEINYLKSGTINIDYSKLNINESQKLSVNADYSTIKIRETKDVNFNSDYGSITIDDANNINGNSDYASMRFETVRKNMTIDTDYGSISIVNLKKGFESVTINAQYAGIRIGVEKEAVFNFEINLQYAGFSRNNNQIEMFKSISKSTSKYYEGKYGKGNSNAKIKIKSQYGGVSIKEN